MLCFQFLGIHWCCVGVGTHTRGLESGSEAGYVLDDFFTEIEFFPFADTVVPKSLDHNSHITVVLLAY